MPRGEEEILEMGLTDGSDTGLEGNCCFFFFFFLSNDING